MIDQDLKDAIHEAMQDAMDIGDVNEERFVAELSKRGYAIIQNWILEEMAEEKGK